MREPSRCGATLAEIQQPEIRAPAVRREIGGVDTLITAEDERFGGNLHVGVDVNLGPQAALFGTGRIDILEGDIAERQTKVVAGLRLKF